MKLVFRLLLRVEDRLVAAGGGESFVPARILLLLPLKNCNESWRKYGTVFSYDS